MPIMTASRKLSALTTYIKLFRTKARHIYWLDLLSLSPETHHISGDVINIPADCSTTRRGWADRSELFDNYWPFALGNSSESFPLFHSIHWTLWSYWMRSEPVEFQLPVRHYSFDEFEHQPFGSFQRIPSVAFLLPSQITENLREPGFSALERDFRPIPKLGIAFLRRNSIRWPFGESTR